MDPVLMAALGKAGGAAVLGLAALGSGLGTGTAGMAAVGAWKRAYAQNKSAPFILITFVGAPLSQTIYGMILMNAVVRSVSTALSNHTTVAWPAMLGLGLFGGLAMGMSAYMQGRVGAAAADALGETGQGFGNYLMAIGVVETVAIFVLVFITATL
jgi:V/A-type H+/Na+-transporting ATPase subunit K